MWQQHIAIQRRILVCLRILNCDTGVHYCLSRPNHIASVLYLFIARPEMSDNLLKIVTAMSNSSLSLQNSVVSSANVGF